MASMQPACSYSPPTPYCTHRRPAAASLLLSAAAVHPLPKQSTKSATAALASPAGNPTTHPPNP